MVRRCVDTDGNEWTERCTRWESGRAFAVSVDVAESEFHRRLFTRFEGEWRIEERADGTRITIAFEFDPRFGPLGVLVSKFFEYRAPPMVNRILDGWEAEIHDRWEAEIHDRWEAEIDARVGDAGAVERREPGQHERGSSSDAPRR